MIIKTENWISWGVLWDIQRVKPQRKLAAAHHHKAGQRYMYVTQSRNLHAWIWSCNFTLWIIFTSLSILPLMIRSPCMVSSYSGDRHARLIRLNFSGVVGRYGRLGLYFVISSSPSTLPRSTSLDRPNLLNYILYFYIIIWTLAERTATLSTAINDAPQNGWRSTIF